MTLFFPAVEGSSVHFSTFIFFNICLSILLLCCKVFVCRFPAPSLSRFCSIFWFLGWWLFFSWNWDSFWCTYVVWYPSRLLDLAFRLSSTLGKLLDSAVSWSLLSSLSKLLELALVRSRLSFSSWLSLLWRSVLRSDWTLWRFKLWSLSGRSVVVDWSKLRSSISRLDSDLWRSLPENVDVLDQSVLLSLVSPVIRSLLWSLDRFFPLVSYWSVFWCSLASRSSG